MAKPSKPPGKGGRPRLNPAFAQALQHYWPMQEGLSPTTSYGPRDLCTPAANLTMNTGIWLYGRGMTPYGTVMGTVVGDGTSKSMFGTVTAALGTTNFSIGGWVLPATSTAVTKCLVSHGAGDASHLEYYLQVSLTSGKAEAGFTTGTFTFVTVISTAAIATSGAMTHLVATYDKVNLKLYVNGLLNATLASTGTPEPQGSNLAVGSIGLGSSYMNGAFSQVFIMKRPMSAGEVRRLYWEPDLFVSGDDIGYEAMPVVNSGTEVPPGGGAGGGELIGPGSQNTIANIT